MRAAVTRKDWKGSGAYLMRALALLLGTLLGLSAVEALSAISLHYLKSEAATEQQLTAVEPIPVRADPYLQYRIRPKVEGIVIRTNSLGLRNAEISLARTPGTVRILILGGSVAWGNSSASNADTIAALLESGLNRRFADRGLRFQVLNAAVPGYVSRQAALSYALYLRDLRPDLVISIDGVNDVYSALLNRLPGLPVERDVFRRDQTPPPLSEWIELRLRRLKSWRLAVALFPAGIESYQTPSPAAVADEYGSAMEDLARLVGLDGGFLQVVLQPMSIFPESKPLTESERAGATKFLARIPGVEHYFRACFEAIRERMKRLQESDPGQVAVLDATLVFQRTYEQAFVDHCHLTSLGRSVLAAQLGETTLNWLKGEARFGEGRPLPGDPSSSTF